MTQLIGKLFGIEDVSTIHEWSVTFSAPWAQKYPVLFLFGAIALGVLGFAYYVRYQQIARHVGRDVMAAFRAIVLVLLLVILAEPSIHLDVTEHPRPLLLTLFDGSDSMNISDHVSKETAEQLTKAMKEEDRPAKLDELSRLDLVKHVLNGTAGETLTTLSEQNRIRAYIMDRNDRVRELDVSDSAESDRFDPSHVAGQLTADAPVTALGMAIDDLNRRHKSPLLAGVVIFSDFDRNAGRDPSAAARELGVPVFTVGIGPPEVVDLSVDMQSPLVLKKDEKATVTVLLRQTGLTGQSALVSLKARRLGSMADSAVAGGAATVAPSKSVRLDKNQVTVDMPFVPASSGRYVLEAKVEPFPDEVLGENNTADREVTVQDDSHKLFFVEYEPTWEWRFVKEVFHRDPLIGQRGFRTFLRSADSRVRRTNELFVESLVRSRAEFFDNDVILLSDIPGEILSEQFEEMLEEYVKQFGGGLVVIAGPKYGIGELNNTIIADMLPVIVDPQAKPKLGDFRLQRTPEADAVDFMNFGKDEHENKIAWGNLGRLPWFQPVLRPHPLATVLATHPSERCVDDQHRQPIIAVRQYGKGEVIYIGFNEMWRLRRKYGEKYYRQFWGQIIYRLGLGRALGSQKRFDVTTDRRVYRAGDQVRVSIEAYDLNFEALRNEKLSARLISFDPDTGERSPERALSIPLARGDSIFETTFPAYAAGRHRIMVRDPATGNEVEADFKVAAVSVEHRSASRNFELQRALGSETGGRHYELFELDRLLKDLPRLQVTETSAHRFPLWNTWLVLLVAITLMLGEWLTRKFMNLR